MNRPGTPSMPLRWSPWTTPLRQASGQQCPRRQRCKVCASVRCVRGLVWAPYMPFRNRAGSSAMLCLGRRCAWPTAWTVKGTYCSRPCILDHITMCKAAYKPSSPHTHTQTLNPGATGGNAGSTGAQADDDPELFRLALPRPVQPGDALRMRCVDSYACTHPQDSALMCA